MAVWAVADTVPGLLAGRAAAGALMFLAQGRLLRSVFDSGTDPGTDSGAGSTARVAAASAGLGAGAGPGGVAASALAQSWGVATIAVVLAVGTLALAAAAPGGRSEG